MDRDQQMQLYLMQQQQHQMLQTANGKIAHDPQHALLSATGQPLTVQEAQQRMNTMHPAGQFRPRPMQTQATNPSPYMATDVDIRRMQAAQQMRTSMQQQQSAQAQRPPMAAEQAAYARSVGPRLSCASFCTHTLADGGNQRRRYQASWRSRWYADAGDG